MILLNRFLFVIVVLFLASLSPSTVAAADAPSKKDAQTVLGEMRLKKWTKELELTEEQQKKVQVIFAAENEEIAKVNADATLSVIDRRAKVQKLHDETYAKMKPLLTAEQVVKFEKALTKPAPKKK